MIFDWFKSNLSQILELFCCDLALINWLWTSIEEFLCKENVGVLGEMLSNFFQNLYFCFGHNLAISYPN